LQLPAAPLPAAVVVGSEGGPAGKESTLPPPSLEPPELGRGQLQQSTRLLIDRVAVDAQTAAGIRW
jgi:hypothetical protein